MPLIKVNQHNLAPMFSDIWDDLFSRGLTERMHWNNAATVPAANIEEKADAFEVTLAAPGLERGDFDIAVDDGVLSIKVEKEAKHEEQDKENLYTRREFSYHAFSRSFTLPEAIEEGKIAAQYKEGILVITLPKKTEATVHAVKKIDVQ